MAEKSSILDALELSGRFITTARLAEEWYRDLKDQRSIHRESREVWCKRRSVCFLSEAARTRNHDTPTGFERLGGDSHRATYEHWWKAQINNKTRNHVVKARKKNVVVRRARFR